MLVTCLVSHDVLQQINVFRPKSTKVIAAIIVVLLDFLLDFTRFWLLTFSLELVQLLLRLFS